MDVNNNSSAPAPRFPLEMDVEYRRSYARNAEAGLLTNISLTGAFLNDSNPELQPSDKIVLNLRVGGRSRLLQAHIIWKSEKGCGVRFVPSNNRDVQIVDDLIYFVENQRDARRTVLADIFKQVS